MLTEHVAPAPYAIAPPISLGFPERTVAFNENGDLFVVEPAHAAGKEWARLLGHDLILCLPATPRDDTGPFQLLALRVTVDEKVQLCELTFPLSGGADPLPTPLFEFSDAAHACRHLMLIVATMEALTAGREFVLRDAHLLTTPAQGTA